MDALLDGELDPDRECQLRRHIVDCPGCRREFLSRGAARAQGPGTGPVPSGDWLGKIENRLARGGPIEEVLKAMFIPWEKKIPLWAGGVVLAAVSLMVLFGAGCGDGSCPPGEDVAVTAPTVPPQPAPTRPLPRLRAGRTGGILIVEEPEGLPPRKNPPPEAWGDHFVTIVVADSVGTLDRIDSLVGELGGSIIGHPVKGFENMGPNEKLVLFDGRVYPIFLERLKEIGQLKHPPVQDAEFITARLTVTEKK